MDPFILLTIVAIVVIIIVMEFDKRQKRRISSNLHNDNLKQLLTITALDYRYNVLDNKEEDDQLLTKQITQLINSYENGEMDAGGFQNQMDFLLNKLN